MSLPHHPAESRRLLLLGELRETDESKLRGSSARGKLRNISLSRGRKSFNARSLCTLLNLDDLQEGYSMPIQGRPRSWSSRIRKAEMTFGRRRCFEASQVFLRSPPSRSSVGTVGRRGILFPSVPKWRGGSASQRVQLCSLLVEKLPWRWKKRRARPMR